MAENDNKESQEQNDKSQEKSTEPSPPIETSHEVKIGGKSYKYTVHTGMMPLKNEKRNMKPTSFSWHIHWMGSKIRLNAPSHLFSMGDLVHHRSGYISAQLAPSVSKCKMKAGCHNRRIDLRTINTHGLT
jgi:hypothetical protein